MVGVSQRHLPSQQVYSPAPPCIKVQSHDQFTTIKYEQNDVCYFRAWIFKRSGCALFTLSPSTFWRLVNGGAARRKDTESLKHYVEGHHQAVTSSIDCSRNEKENSIMLSHWNFKVHVFQYPN